jgi:hypothetical protein
MKTSDDYQTAKKTASLDLHGAYRWLIAALAGAARHPTAHASGIGNVRSSLNYSSPSSRAK